MVTSTSLVRIVSQLSSARQTGQTNPPVSPPTRRSLTFSATRLAAVPPRGTPVQAAHTSPGPDTAAPQIRQSFRFAFRVAIEERILRSVGPKRETNVTLTEFQI